MRKQRVLEDEGSIVPAGARRSRRKDSDEILEFFSDDAVYHNMPMAPVQGKAAINTVLDM